MDEELKNRLIVGARIKLGEKYCKARNGCNSGDVIELIKGEFDEDNGLYTYTSTAPSIWNEERKEFDSIYHLFGNDLEDFWDCEIITPS